MGRRSEFERWINDEYESLDADDLIDPQLFLEWQHSLLHTAVEHVESGAENGELTGTDGRLSHYAVIPFQQGDVINWIDAAGYELARSTNEQRLYSSKSNRNDFELRIRHRSASVKRVFKAKD